MPRARANGIDIEYDTFGDRRDRPLLLVMGLGAQLVMWDERLCRLLADRGHFVVRYDNRDVGLSTKVEAPGLDLMTALVSVMAGQPVRPPYLLSDMAADAAGLLDALGLPAAHVVGASMGGMIAQTLAIEHPDRVLTLTSIMSSTGDQDVGQPTGEALQAVLQRPPRDRAGAVAHAVAVARVICTPEHLDEDAVRARAGTSFDRCYDPAGVGRQLLAIVASGSRTAALRDVRVPTLVVHGDRDALVDVSGGRRTAEAVPGAELVVVPGMGHDLPPAHWGTIVDAVCRLTARVPAPR